MNTMTPLYKLIASALQASLNCERSGNAEWHVKHREAIGALVREHMPSGSGFDHGTAFDGDRSTPDKLVFNTSYHHAGESGYTHWTDHSITVRASLVFGITLTISGRDYRGFKDYCDDVFRQALLTEVKE
jgi:hypothetical protein